MLTPNRVNRDWPQKSQNPGAPLSAGKQKEAGAESAQP